ncbi:MAG: hypothetical protein U5N86_03580 [Planctomycetota bacterium]|nr:hypothetical protein [Planctomycetota bacterium]
MKNKYRLIFTTSLVVIIVALLLARPDKPALVVLGYSPSVPRDRLRADRFEKQLHEMSVKSDKKQYVLYIEFGDTVRLHYSEGPKPLDENGREFLQNTTVFYCASLDVARSAHEMELMDDAVWVASAPEDERALWSELFNDLDAKSWLDTSTLDLAQVERAVREARPETTEFLLYDPSGELDPPSGWLTYNGTDWPPDLMNVAVVVLPETDEVPDIPGSSFLVGMEKHGPHFALSVDKDTPVVAARMTRTLLDKGLMAAPKNPEPLLTVRIPGEPSPSPHPKEPPDSP